MLMEIEIEIGEGEGERETETERQREKEREEWGSQRHCCRSLIFFDPISVFFSASHSCSITRPLTHSQQDTQAHQRLHFPVKNHHRTTTASPVHVSTMVEREGSVGLNQSGLRAVCRVTEGAPASTPRPASAPPSSSPTCTSAPICSPTPASTPRAKPSTPARSRTASRIFFEDLFEELSKYGLIESLNICDNLADHMIGERFPLAVKELGTCDLYSQTVVERKSKSPQHLQMRPRFLLIGLISALASLLKLRSILMLIHCTWRILMRVKDKPEQWLVDLSNIYLSKKCRTGNNVYFAICSQQTCGVLRHKRRLLLL